jgi:HK97 family phage prohead protease
MLCCKRSEAASRFGSAYSRQSSLSKGKKKDDRVVIGWASVFGNIDVMNEVVDIHAFDKAILDFYAGRSRAVFLWNHDSSQPPIGKILAMRALSREQLPREVITTDPNITGALEVTKQYFDDAFADRVYKGVISGAIREMSFAYEVTRRREEERDGKTVRVLEELEIYDVADVNWGANSATVARVTSPKRRGTTSFSSHSSSRSHAQRVAGAARSKLVDMAIATGNTETIDRLFNDLQFRRLRLLTNHANRILNRS